MNHVWRIGHRTSSRIWVVAETAEEAWGHLLDQRGDDEERAEREADGESWEQLPDDKLLQICCDDDGDPCDCDDAGEEGVVTKTCGEWAQRGPGFLCEDE